jgi:hypothetical protein
MGFDQGAVIKVRDVEPEVFWIVWIDSELPINSFIKLRRISLKRKSAPSWRG